MLLVASVSQASSAQADRIRETIDDSQLVVLKGNVSPRAKVQYDQGPLVSTTKLTDLRIMFRPSPAQQADLTRWLFEQQDTNSPNYHKWLTPEQYADRFGLSQHDVAKVVAWLKSEGFTVTAVAHGRRWVVFSGTVAEMQKTFHTEIHRYIVEGEEHFANASEPAIPKALAGVVSGLSGFNDFRLRPMSRPNKIAPLAPMSFRANPDYTSGGSNFLAPDDIATIYDISKLYSQGYDGTGQAIAVVGQSDIHATDLSNFWTFFRLTPPTLNKIVDPDTGNPGFTSDEVEADLDLETVSGVARNATIYYVFGTSAVDAAEYAIDNPSLIPVSVISISFGACEPQQPSSAFSQLESLAQQGNAEGITFAASSGDTGAAACELNGQSRSATTGLAVNVPASVPEVTGVGGTEFSGDVNNQSQYWSTTNSPTGESALSYIPEMAWNDSDGTGTGPILSATLAASGGGASIAYTKPSWQVGTGVPNDGARDVPDVAMTASANHDGYVIFCSNVGFGCTAGSPLIAIGGTSAAAPVFSGILALLNHYLVKNGFQTAPGLGNINQTLYQLAQSNSSAFHDITTGSNIVPCTNPSANCPTSSPFQFGYSAGVGYDQVTGLGSVDAYNFVTGFASELKTPTTTTQSITATPSPAQSNAGSLVTLTATVGHSSGSSTPTGTVTFSNGSTVLAVENVSTTGIATFSTSSLAVGAYSITATYSGDNDYAGSTSATVTLNVVDFTATANPTTLTVSAPGQNGQTNITITPLSGFNQTLSYSCSGLPSESTCTFTAVSATSETLTIQTTAPSSRLDGTPPGFSEELFYAFLLPGFFGFFTRDSRRRTTLRTMALAVALGLAVLIPSCGGGSSSTPTNPGTPTGTSPVTVTVATAGSSPLSHQIQLTLTVQ